MGHRHQSEEQVRTHFDGGAMALATSDDVSLEGGGQLLGTRLGGAGRVTTTHFEGGSMVLDGPPSRRRSSRGGGDGRGDGGEIGDGPPWPTEFNSRP
eukprot:scaffold5588_cov62-Phaeocystis_antarctica.AAC.2